MICIQQLHSYIVQKSTNQIYFTDKKVQIRSTSLTNIFILRHTLTLLWKIDSKVSLSLASPIMYQQLSFRYQGTGGSAAGQTPQACGKGHYCPAGTEFPEQHPCVAGSWTNRTNLADQQECTQCPREYFCTGGKAAPDGLCPKGRYCPEGKVTTTI